MESGVNTTGEVIPYGGKSAFSQLEHNIVAAYLITAGTNALHSTHNTVNQLNYFRIGNVVLSFVCHVFLCVYVFLRIIYKLL